MTNLRHIRVAVALLAASAASSCTPADVPQPSGNGTVILPSDTTSSSDKGDITNPSDTTSSSGGKDNVGRDSLPSSGKDPITLPGFNNPTPKPILKPDKPDKPDEPSDTPVEDEGTINEALIGEWRGVSYATELRTEEAVQRVDSVGFGADNSLTLRLNNDGSCAIIRPQQTVEGTWQGSNGRLFVVYDTASKWSETYMFDIVHNDANSLTMELCESQTPDATTPQRVYILWLARK